MANYRQYYIVACLNVENHTEYPVDDFEGFNEQLMPANQLIDVETEYFLPNINIERYGFFVDVNDDCDPFDLRSFLIAQWLIKFATDFAHQIALIKAHHGNGEIVFAFVPGFV